MSANVADEAQEDKAGFFPRLKQRLSKTRTKFSEGLQDAFLNKGKGIGSTFLGEIPFLRIDYILHSQTLNTHSFDTHQQKLSDHKAIESSLGL